MEGIVRSFKLHPFIPIQIQGTPKFTRFAFHGRQNKEVYPSTSQHKKNGCYGNAVAVALVGCRGEGKSSRVFVDLSNNTF